MVGIHVHAKPYKGYALLLEAHALLEAVFSAEEYLASGADDALPWHSRSRSMQSPCDLARHAGKPGGVSNVSVRGDPTARDATDGREEFLEVLRVRIGVGVQGGEILNDQVQRPSKTLTLDVGVPKNPQRRSQSRSKNSQAPRVKLFFGCDRQSQNRQMLRSSSYEAEAAQSGPQFQE